MNTSFFRILMIPLALGSTCLLQYSQQQHEVIVRNIIVPVRVFDGDKFISDLTIEDIELFEEGTPQKIQALYLAKEYQIERMEGRDYFPYAGRSFYFMFHLTEFHSEVADALDYFFSEIYMPEDYVVVQTPLKYYDLSRDAVKTMPREELINSIQAVIRKDIVTASNHYNTLMKDLVNITRSLSTGQGGDRTLELYDGFYTVLDRYRQGLLKLEEITSIKEQGLIDFAKELKKMDGQKNIFLFCQSEFRPKLRTNDVNRLLFSTQEDPNTYGLIQELFQYYRKENNLDAELIKRAFSDSSILFNFMFITKRPDSYSGIQMEELSEDLYETFSEIAEATGGIVDNSQNLSAAFKTVSARTEMYYLLYYSPTNYVKDGKFREISVRVRNKNYKILHRLGYVAD